MQYNFDEVIDRRNTASYKYDLRKQFFKDPDVLPMWVADMDFRTPDFVINALHERLNHEVLGYSFHPESQYQSIIDWNRKRHGWDIKKEWIGFTPGVVPALNFTVLAFTQPGDKVIVQTPVYFPFYSAVTEHGRQLIPNPLVLENGHYRIDFDNLKAQIDSQTKMLILCSPHNPTGNVWRREELKELTDICLRNNILIVSDEIHADVVYPGYEHIPTHTLGEEIANNTITLMAASKTFNIAGLATSYYVVSNNSQFSTMDKAIGKFHLGMGNILGNTALEAAYNNGEDWLLQLIAYLQQNILFTKDFINNNIPVLKLIEPEATFMLWIDFRETGIEDQQLRNLLVKDARVGLSNGILFGPDGEGFQRINIGCPRATLEKGLRQIAGALRKVLR